MESLIQSSICLALFIFAVFCIARSLDELVNQRDDMDENNDLIDN